MASESKILEINDKLHEVIGKSRKSRGGMNRAISHNNADINPIYAASKKLIEVQ